jgi:hypothetical protein
MKQQIKNMLGTKNTKNLSVLKRSINIHLKRISRRREKALTELPIKTISLPNEHIFFSYYDFQQFSQNSNLLLGMVAPNINTTPKSKTSLKVGFFNLNQQKPEFQQIGSTTTWCWQMGCRLQWYPSRSNSQVIYNKLVDGQYGCVIQDIQSKKSIKRFNRPIYTVSPEGKWGLSVTFSRLQRFRPGYGYNTFPDASINDPAPSEDGIWRIDLETGNEKLLFSIEDIVKLGSNEVLRNTHHYLNHLQFNLEGKLFLFFHCVHSKDNSRKVRLMTSDISGKNIKILNNGASHCTWKNNSHILDGSSRGYHLFDINSGNKEIVGKDILKVDGHPTYLPGKDWIITDTYPDRYGEQSLLLYNYKTNNLKILYKEFIPLEFQGETRCDFHPRVSHSGQYVCIDTVVNRKRAMKVFDISSLI